MHPSVRTVVTYVDPRKTGQFQLPHWRWLAEYSDAVRRVPLVLAVRLRCYCIVGMWLCRFGHKLFKDVLVVARNGILRIVASVLVSQPK
jgi:hypothetical protein